MNTCPFIRLCETQHPCTAQSTRVLDQLCKWGASEVETFLTQLATNRKVSASIHNQALSDRFGMRGQKAAKGRVPQFSRWFVRISPTEQRPLVVPQQRRARRQVKQGDVVWQ